MTDLEPEEFRRLGHAFIDWMASYREGLPDRPVRPDVALAADTADTVRPRPLAIGAPGGRARHESSTNRTTSSPC